MLAHRRNHSINNNRVLKRAEVNDQIVKNEGVHLAETREKIIAVIKMIVGGDTMAAEYILLNIISRVHTRKDALILGNVTLNISNINFLQGRNLAALIKQITPFTLYLPLTLETLETKKFSPRKNYDTNLLESGLLQMVDGTFLIGDETVMKTGTVKENGIASIKAIATLIEQQVVEYDFQYY